MTESEAIWDTTDLYTTGEVTLLSTAVLLGDVNLDGEVNGLDIDPFVEVLLDGRHWPEADMNEDQVVNGLDVDPFVAAVVGDGAQPVPEPSTLLFAIIALGVVGGWRKWGGWITRAVPNTRSSGPLGLPRGQRAGVSHGVLCPTGANGP